MEQVLSKLCEIEITAEKIMEDISAKKLALTEEMEQASREFDETLQQQTSARVNRIRQQLEADKEQQLAALRTDTQTQIASVKTYYEQNQDSLVKEIFEKILNN